MSFYVDPKDVLNHLNQLGYRNITKDQLREFIQDLKKLIKNDVRNTSREPLDVGAYVGMTLNELTHDEKRDTTTSTMVDSRTSSVFSEALSGPAYSTSYTSSDLVDCSRRPKPQKISSVSKSADFRPICTHAVPKAKSSFIRPWQLAGPANHNTDPVSLFHRYQALWKLQKLPGEDRHADLRWSVRERMLGREVRPRPICRHTSVGSFKR